VSATHDAPRNFEMLERAFRELLIEAGVVTDAEIDARVEYMHARTPALGAKVVARAWFDPAFKARLLADGSAAVRELGIEVGALKLVVVENTPEVHNLIVCTLCSCYPRMLLGMAPDWYKSIAYRSRAVREPRAVLEEFGVRLDPGTTVRVHDSTADMRYLVLPERPRGSEGLTEAECAALVGRDAMIGTALAGA
jgi:nitrile hydratase